MNFKKIACLLLLTVPLYMAAQTKLTSLSTTRYLTHATPTIKSLTVYGDNLWPKYMTHSMSLELVKVHFKKDGRDAIVQRSSSGADQIVVSFASTDWLTTPGTIEVYVMMGTVDGTPAVKTNSLFITVDQMPRFPPVITDVQPKEFKTGLARETYVVTISGNHFGEAASTTVTIGGIKTNAARVDVDNGWMRYYLPEGLINTPGTYDVVVKTAFGTSPPAQVTIINPNAVKAVPIKQPMKVTTMANTKPVSTTANQVSVPVTTAPVTTTPVQTSSTVVLAQGARVIMKGNIGTAAEKTDLENYIRGIESVTTVTNEFAVGGNNANMLIIIKPVKLDASSTDRIKASIQEKLKDMKITTANVVIEK